MTPIETLQACLGPPQPGDAEISFMVCNKADADEAKLRKTGWERHCTVVAAWADQVIADKKQTQTVAYTTSAGRRGDAYVQAITAMFFDIDTNEDPSELLAALDSEDVAYLWSESCSSTADHIRWHLVLPFAAPEAFPPDEAAHAERRDQWRREYAAVADWLCALGGLQGRVWDIKCKNPSRARFVGSRLSKDAAPRAIRYSASGRRIIWPQLVEALGVAAPVASAEAPSSSAEAPSLARASTVRRHRGATPGHTTGSLLRLSFAHRGTLGPAVNRDGKAATMVLCPWAAEHTTGEQAAGRFDSSTVIFAASDTSDGGFSCLHSHCDGRTAADVLSVARKTWRAPLPDSERGHRGERERAMDTPQSQVARLADRLRPKMLAIYGHENAAPPAAGTDEGAEIDRIDIRKVARPAAAVKAIHPTMLAPRQLSPMRTPSWPCTDAGNAERIAAYYGDALRYDTTSGAWLVYDGRVWASDEPASMTVAVKSARAIWGEVAQLRAAYAVAAGHPWEQRDVMQSAEETPKRKRKGKAETTTAPATPAAAPADAQPAAPPTDAAEAERIAARIGALVQWQQRSESCSALRDGLKVARGLPGLSVSRAQLDSSPWLLSVANGTIDLKTGELRDHDPADMITRLVPVAYDPAATCPTWDRFVAESMCGDASMVAFLQRVAGYSITGDVSAEAWFLHVGDGANGKSTFFEILSALLGDMACAVPVGVLTGSPSESEDPKSMSARAKLAGRRLAIANESAQMATLDDATSKMLASNAHIPAKFMGRDIFEYMPSHKLHLTTNHPPRVRGSEYGVWRRIYPVRWDNVVTNPDLTLQHKLRGELPGILAWCVRGALAYQAQGLAPPPPVLRARDAMREASDTIGIFLQDTYDLYAGRREATPKELRRLGISVTVADLRQAYTAWCAREGEKFPLGPTALRVALASHGCPQDKDRSDNRAYLGLVPRGMLRSIIPQQPQQHLPAVN
mgnify:CR=1 FL=1